MDRTMFGMIEGLEREGKKAWGNMVVRPLAQEVELDIPAAIKKVETEVSEAERVRINQKLDDLELRGRIFDELTPLTTKQPEEVAEPAKPSDQPRGMSNDQIAACILTIATAALNRDPEALHFLHLDAKPAPAPRIGLQPMDGAFLQKMITAAESDDETVGMVPLLKAFAAADAVAARREVRRLGLCE
jgi:hypothetical protein